MPKKLNSRKKRKLRTATYPKKLRSDLPRRKRIPLIPIIDGSSNQLFEVEDTDFPSFQAPACSSTGEISCESSVISVGSENPKKRPRLKENKAIGGSRVELRADAHGLSRSDRPITRSYYKNARLESLIAEPLSDENDRDFGRSDADSVVSLKQRTRSAPKAEEKDGKAISAATCSETSCLEPVFQENLKQKTRSCSGDEKSLQNQANAPSTDTVPKCPASNRIFRRIPNQTLVSVKEVEIHCKFNGMQVLPLEFPICLALNHFPWQTL